MVTVSRESWPQAEARLRHVMRGTKVEWLSGVWEYVEADPGPGRAIAHVARAEGFSWLVRTYGQPQGEAFAVFQTTFPAEVDNSGFVGWLASRIKAATGSGVVVVCGYSKENGGVYDYWGVPISVEQGVRQEIQRLVDGSGAGLSNVVMSVVETAPNAEIGPETVFCFDQDGDRISARYAGGAVKDGWLIGTLSGAEGAFSYLQVGDGGIRTGHSTMTLHTDPATGLKELVEHFDWDAGHGTNRLHEA